MVLSIHNTIAFRREVKRLEHATALRAPSTWSLTLETRFGEGQALGLVVWFAGWSVEYGVLCVAWCVLCAVWWGLCCVLCVVGLLVVCAAYAACADAEEERESGGRGEGEGGERRGREERRGRGGEGEKKSFRPLRPRALQFKICFDNIKKSCVDFFF